MATPQPLQETPYPTLTAEQYMQTLMQIIDDSNMPPHREITLVDGHEVIVRWDDQRQFPAGCSPSEVIGLIEKFLKAFHQGDQLQLAKLFFNVDNPEQQYPSEWFSVTYSEKDHFTAYSLKELLPYFAERHRQHEQLRLLWLALSSRALPIEEVGLYFGHARYADDLKPRAENPQLAGQGKGSIDCQKQRIRAWSMGVH